jgi:hypothetical protein
MGWDAGGVEELPGASGTKKDGTNGLAVRAGRPVTQLTSSSGAVVRPVPSLEYIHHSIDWGGVKYKNRNFYLGSEKSSFGSPKHLTARRTDLSRVSCHRRSRTSEQAKMIENPLESDDCQPDAAPVVRAGGWVRNGALAVGGALAGGLLAVWWYRNTLNQLRQAEADSKNPHFGSSADLPDHVEDEG